MDDAAKKSILLIDDDKTNIVILTQILSTEYTLYVAKSGQGGINLAEKFLPDLILLDVLMPEMDGYETLKRLRNSEATRNIPIVFITGLDSSEAKEKGMAMGAADYINKPFIIENVKQIVQSILNGH